MCTKYGVRQTAAEVAASFGVSVPTPWSNAPNTPAEAYPGGPGLVIREDAGARVIQSMTWGFPLAQKSKKTGLPIKPKPVVNIAELDGWMWRHIAGKPEHRCLIPVSAYAEAEGADGAKTRTWLTVKDQPLFAWAGMWKQSDEWGAVYSGMTTDANEAVRTVHHRMLVILHRDEHDRWLRGTYDDVMAFQKRVFPPELIEIQRTGELWIKPRTAPAQKTLI